LTTYAPAFLGATRIGNYLYFNGNANSPNVGRMSADLTSLEYPWLIRSVAVPERIAFDQKNQIFYENQLWRRPANIGTNQICTVKIIQ